MFFTLFLFLTQAKKRICVCNNECSLQCPDDRFIATASNLQFTDFLLSKIKNEKEVEIDFYSKNKDFLFEIDASCFGDTKVTLKTLKDSNLVKVNIKERYQSFNKVIDIKPNFQVNLPDVVPFESRINSNHQKIIMEEPESTPVPISVSIDWMTKTNEDDLYCETQHCPTDKELSNIDVYECGKKCWTTNNNRPTLEYTFKGERFAIYGTKDPAHSTFDLYLNDELLTEIDEYNNERQHKVLLYLSDILEYNTYKIKVVGKGNIFEIYKFAFWPSIKAKRVNSTDMTQTKTWNTEPDYIGGLGQWTNNVGATKSYTMNCNKVWVYGSEAFNHGEMNIKFAYDNIDIDTKNDNRVDGKMLYESETLPFSLNEITITAKKDIYILCIYYLYDPPDQTQAPNPSRTPIPDSDDKYINKEYKDNEIPDQEIVNPESRVKQISGCTFTDIRAAQRIYFIRLNTEIPIFDNTFQYSELRQDYSCPIWAAYNGELTISHCTFINCMHNTKHDQADGNVLNVNSANNVNVKFDTCSFINCGNKISLCVIGVLSEGSKIHLKSCQFSFDDPITASKPILTNTKDVEIDNCFFNNSGTITLKSTSTNGIFRFTNNTVVYNRQSFLSIENLRNAPIISGNIFRNNDMMEASYFMTFNGIFADKIELVSNTYRNMRISSGIQYGGSSSHWFGPQAEKLISLTYTDCHFIYNLNDHTESPYSDGGAFQCGYSSTTSRTSLNFNGCEFKGNNCPNGKGGALAISINQKLNISNCIFEGNTATQGGAIYIYGKVIQGTSSSNVDTSPMDLISISNCQFILNKATSGAPGILIEEDNIKIKTLNISLCQFTDNNQDNTQALIKCSCENIIFSDNIVEYSNLDSSCAAIDATFNGITTLTQSTFTNCKASKDSSIQLSGTKQSSTTINDCNFINCKANKYSVVILNSKSYIENSNFNFDNSANACSGMEINSPSLLSISNCNFRNNKNDQGKGNLYIHSESGTTEITDITDITFESCIGNEFQAINIILNDVELSPGDSLSIQNLNITNVQSISSSSFIYQIKVNQDISFSDCTFDNCNSNNQFGGGSGASLIPLKKISFENCKWINNYCSGNGGAFQHGNTPETNGHELKFNDCEFTGNRSPKFGGALSIETTADITITNCNFLNNRAAYTDSESANLLAEENGLGGAVYINSKHSTGTLNFEIVSNTFRENEASDGHALCIQAGDANVDISEFASNHFIDNGVLGSTIVSDKTIDIKTSTFETSYPDKPVSNPIRFDGKAPAKYEDMNFSSSIVINQEQSGYFTGCTFKNCQKNQSVDPSVQQYVITVHSNQFYFDNCRIEFDDTTNAMGAICIDSRCNITITNSFFTKCNYKGAGSDDPNVNTQSAGIYYEPIDQSSRATEKLVMQDVVFDGIAGVNARCFKITIDYTTMTCDRITIQNLPTGGHSGAFYFTETTRPNYEFTNWRFIRITSNALLSGGCSLWIAQKEKKNEINVNFRSCYWEGNKAEKSVDSDSAHNRPNLHNGQGGAFQFGYSESNYYMYLLFEDCNFIHNVAQREGGALAIHTTGIVTIDRCTFTGNEAQTTGSGEGGGALFIDPDFINPNVNVQRNQRVSITNCSFTNNRAKYGSAIYVKGETSTCLLSDLTFDNNPGANSMLYSSCKGLVLESCAFTSTEGTRGIHIATQTRVDFRNIDFRGLHLGQEADFKNGGAVLLMPQESSNLELLAVDNQYVFEGCNFTDCIALGGSGGAIYASNIGEIGLFTTKFDNCKVNGGDGSCIYVDKNVNMFELDKSNKFININDPQHYIIVSGANEFRFEDFNIDESSNNNVKPIRFIGGGDMIFNNLTFEGLAGGIKIEKDVKSAVIEKCNFINCNCGNDYVITIENSNCQFKGNSIIFNKEGKTGRALCILSNGAIEIENNEFINCNPLSNTNNLNPTIKFDPPIDDQHTNRDVTFKYNTIEGINKAVKFNLFYFNLINGNFDFSHNIISHCSNTNKGMNGYMIYINKITSDLTFDNNTFDNIESGSDYGGSAGFWIEPPNKNDHNSYPKLTFSNCKFTNNRHIHTTGGGAFQMGGSSIAHFETSFDSCIFDRNSAVGNGGAVCLHLDKPTAFRHCIFTFNHADRKGGAIYIETTHMATCPIEACRFEENYDKDGDGSAIYIKDESTSKTNSVNLDQYCYFKNNSNYRLSNRPNKYNFAIHTESPHFSISDSRIEANDVLNYVCGIKFAKVDSENTVHNTSFYKCYNNNSANTGSAIEINQNVQSVEIQSCQFEICGRRHDRADKYFDYYTIYDAGKNSVINNCLFSGNLNDPNTPRAPAIKVLTFGRHEITNCILRRTVCTNRGAIFYEPTNGQASDEHLTLHNISFSEPEGNDRVAIHFTVNSENVFISDITFKDGTLGPVLIGFELKNNVNSFTFDKFKFIDNRCSASYGGGSGIWEDNKKIKRHITFSQCEFRNNAVESNVGAETGNGGGLQLINDGNVLNDFTVSNCTFIGNTADRFGGGLSVAAKNTIIIENSVFERNHADEFGGAIYIDSMKMSFGCTIAISGCTFNNNNCSNGCAIYISEESNRPTANNKVPIITINGNCTFNNNIEQKEYSLIMTKGTDVSISDVSFDLSDSSKSCRAIHSDVNAVTEIENVLFRNCRVPNGEGNAIKFEESNTQSTERNPIIHNCIFENCGTSGWTVHSLSTSFTFTDNIIRDSVGGLYSVSGVIERNTFENISPDGSGCGLTLRVTNANTQSFELVLRDILFDNCAGSDVRCFDLSFNYAPNIEIENITVQNCPAREALIGVVYVDQKLNNGGSVTFNNCNWTNNKVTKGSKTYGIGGGIGFAVKCSSFQLEVILQECLFESNSISNDKGGAIQVGNNASTITPKYTFDGCTFKGNTATSGGALALETSSGWEVRGCTFENNRATGGNSNFGMGEINNGGGALYINPNPVEQTLSSNCLVTGCTFLNNFAAKTGLIAFIDQSSNENGYRIIFDGTNQMDNAGEDGFLFYNSYQTMELNDATIAPGDKYFSILSSGENGRTEFNNCVFNGVGFRVSDGNNLGNVMRLFKSTTVQLTSCDFIDCVKVNHNNFIIYGSDSREIQKSLIAKKCNFNFTTHTQSCAAVCIERFAYMDIDECNFVNCWNSQFAGYASAIRYGLNGQDGKDNCKFVLKNSLFQNCNNDHANNADGRVIQGYGNLQSTFTNCTIRDTVKGRYIFKWDHISGSNVTQFELSQFKFINNIADCLEGGGAGIYINRAQNIVFSNCIFTGNSFDNSTAVIGGGAVGKSYDFTNLKSVLYDGCTFEDNKAANQNGGSLFISSPKHSTTVEGCKFINTLNVNDPGIAKLGGAIYIDADNKGGVSIKGCQFDNLHSKTDGNAICIAQDAGLVTVDDCTFTDCHYNNGHSVIWDYGSDFKFINSRIFFNDNKKSSRGIIVNSPYKVEIIGSTFYNCVYNEHGCGFAYNAANKKDPNKKESIIIENTVFDSCYSSTSTKGRACALYLNINHPASLIEVTIQNSNPPADKFIIYIESPAALLREQPQIFESCHFLNCTTEYTQNYAGGIGLQHDKIEDLVFNNCQFYNLRSTGFGGAVAFHKVANNLEEYSVEFNGCKFANNSATGGNGRGASLYFNISYQATIKDCNFTDQSLTGYGGAICIDGAFEPFIFNNGFYSTQETGSGHGNAIYLVRGLPIATISQNRFVNCGTKGSVIESEAKTFIFNNGNIIQFTAPNGGSRGLHFPVQCRLELSNSTITGCRTSESGGGLYYVGGNYDGKPEELIQLEKVIFENNNASNGCAILMQPRTLPNFTSCTIRKHVSGKYIFAIFYQVEVLQEISIDSCIFEENYFNSGIDGGGSGIWIAAAQYLTNKHYPIGLNKCVFRNNRASQYGGAFAYGVSGTLKNIMVNLRECEFYNNVADGGKGGAIWINTQVEFTIDGCSFNGDNLNAAQRKGHAIYCDADSRVSIVDTVFTDCGSNNDGSAIVFSGTKIHMEDTTIQYTDVKQASRGIEIDVSTSIELIRSSFIKCNSAGCSENNWGGGIYFHVTGDQSSDSVLKFEDLIFDNNSAPNACAALFDTSIAPDIHGCTFRNHQSGNYVFDIFFNELQLFYDLRGCIFESNSFNVRSGSEDGGGSGVWIANKEEIAQQRGLQLYFTDCQWRDNVSPHVGGAFAIGRSNTVKSTDLVLDGCTFSANIAKNNGGALWIATKSGIEIKNCAFRNNVASAIAGSIIVESTAPTCTITKCTFTRDNAQTKANSIYINSLSTETFLTENTFVDCGYESSSDEVVSINVRQFEYTENTISFTNILNSCRGLTLESIGTHAIRDSTFSKCNLTTGNKFGAGIYYSCPDDSVNNDEIIESILIDGCTFDYCSAESGSALYINPKNVPEITNNVVQNSRIGQYSLTFILKRGVLTDYTLEGWTFYNNKCYPKTINSNTKYDGGGSGIYIGNSGSNANTPFNLTFHKCNWTLNSSPYKGGALAYGDSTELKNINLIFDDCVFVRNNCKTELAGCLWLSSSSEASLLITKSRFEANKALSNTSIGGNIYLDQSYYGKVDIIDTEFTKNSAIDANALYISQNVQVVNIERCNIISNGNTNSQIINLCGELNIIDSEVGFGQYTLSARSLAVIAPCRLTVRGSSFTNCKTNDNSVGRYVDSSFKNSGGAILYHAKQNTPNEEQIIIEDSTFDNCRGSNGAAIILHVNTDFVFHKNTIQNCRGGNFILSIFSHKNYIEEFNIDECTFHHNKFVTPESSRDGGGSALWISNDRGVLPPNGYNVLNFRNCHWTQNQASDSGGAMAYGESYTIGNTALTYDHCEFRDNLANGPTGGALWLHMSRPLLISDCTFESNTASGSGPHGGAITIDSPSTSVNILRCTFNSNSAANANAISITETTPDVNITECTFNNNHGNSNYNNVIRIKSKAVTIDSCTINSDSIYKSSRGIDIESKCIAVIRDTEIHNAQYPDQGAGIYYRVDSNTDNDESILIEGCLFDNCQARNGQAIMAYPSTPIILRNNLIWNQKSGKFIVSVIYLGDVNETYVEDCYFEHNFFNADPTSGGGSGLWVSREDKKGQTLILNGCTFRDNECRYNGGGFAIGSSNTFSFTNIEFNDCYFINNTAGEQGGAFAYQGQRSNLVLHSCFFDGNKAGNVYYGGAIYIKKENPRNSPNQEENFEGEVTIEDCKFARNNAIGGGAVYCYAHDSVTFNSNIFSENTADDNAPNLYIMIDKSCKQNVVLSNNKFDFLKAPGQYQIYVGAQSSDEEQEVPEISLIFIGNCFTRSGDGETVAHIKSDFNGTIQLSEGNCFDLPREVSIEVSKEENIQVAQGIFDCHTCQVPSIPTSPPTNMPTASPGPTPEPTTPPPTATSPPSGFVPPATEVVTSKPTTTSSSSSSSTTIEPTEVPTLEPSISTSYESGSNSSGSNKNQTKKIVLIAGIAVAAVVIIVVVIILVWLFVCRNRVSIQQEENARNSEMNEETISGITGVEENNTTDDPIWAGTSGTQDSPLFDGNDDNEDAGDAPNNDFEESWGVM
ncbi:hypothetical protein M9Y10_000044 [Tritrichomonas musculus]|uniref:Right handed beta helix domain-containing protein n=1 Tax=Tritrichomonas musculus TaxID=1915356 RepID=A0ABR2L459_9EUKA